jgi:hypothetical protein
MAKDLIRHRFALVDQNDEHVGQRLVNEVFSPDGVFATPRGSWIGAGMFIVLHLPSTTEFSFFDRIVKAN